MNLQDMTPKKIVERLDETVVSQRVAKEKLAYVLWHNQHRLQKIAAGVDPDTITAKSNLLLLGPSGSGKTFLIGEASKILDIPFFRASATDFSGPGYVGANVPELLGGLLDAANRDVERAKRGIIFIDEIDKIRTRNFSGGNDDVAGKTVQQALLTMIEGNSSRASQSIPGSVSLDTSGVTFIVAGAFVGIRVGPDSPHLTLSDALIEFGIIPEFTGRFAAMAETEALGRQELHHLVCNVKNSVLKRMVNTFRLEGVKLHFEDSAIEAIVDLALRSPTGARALAQIFSDRLVDVTNRLPDLRGEGITEIIIDAATIMERKPARMIKGRPVWVPAWIAGSTKPSARNLWANTHDSTAPTEADDTDTGSGKRPGQQEQSKAGASERQSMEQIGRDWRKGDIRFPRNEDGTVGLCFLLVVALFFMWGKSSPSVPPLPSFPIRSAEQPSASSSTPKLWKDLTQPKLNTDQRSGARRSSPLRPSGERRVDRERK